MSVVHANNALSPGAAQRRSVLLLPVVQKKPESIEYAWSDLPRLLLPNQHLVIGLEECRLTLRQGRRVLAQAALRPLAFRVFLALLVARQQERSSPYAELLALTQATQEQVAWLLTNEDTGRAWLEEATKAQRQALEDCQTTSEREHLLKPLRRAIRERAGLGRVLTACRFRWVVQNRYGRGYWLAQRL